MTKDLVPFLWLCGPDGVGKSTVGWEIHRQLASEGMKNAYVDLDQIGSVRPAPSGDPDNHRVKAHNLGAMWANFGAVGAACLVVSGVVDTRDEVQLYTEAVPGTELTLCRLRAEHRTLTERLLRRQRGAGPPIPGDELRGLPPDEFDQRVLQALRYADQLERDGIGHMCVDTDGQSVQEVARRVRADWRMAVP